MHILILNGDAYSNSLAQFVMTKADYEVESVDNQWEAFQMIQRREPSLLILDVTLSSMNGFEFAERLYAKGYKIPLLFTAAQDVVEAEFQHFNIGVNDYICKPYNHQELVARVQGLMFNVNKGRDGNKQKLRVGDIEFIPKDSKVTVKEKSVVLTRTEAEVFKVLINNFNKTIKREQFLVEVWNDSNCNTNIVDVYISRLRAKIEDSSGRPRYITSTRGVGYKLTG